MKFILIQLFAFIVLLNSCQEGNNKPKIGFLFSDFNSPRWEREANLFKDRINSNGGESFIAVAGGDELKQYNQALEFINKGIDVLVITATNANTAADIVRIAHKNKVKVIAYDGLILNAELDYLVAFDLKKVGELQAAYISERLPKGNYIIFNGDVVHQAAIEMYSGILKVLGPSINENKINVVYTGWIESWSGINARHIVQKILEFSTENIDAIIAANDGIANGIVEELISRGLNKQILITGQDGDLDACNRIYNGEQTMTVYKSSRQIAFATADLALKLAKGEKAEGLVYLNNGKKDVPTLMLEPVSVDKSNLESVIVADGIYSMDQIINYSNP
ncbi:MAG: substrate-binding domain-containing protein [Bacteroidales bacterium]